MVACERQLVGQRQLELTVDRRRPQGDVLDGLHQDPASLRPPVDGLVEQMAGQAVDLAQVAVLVHRLRVDVVGGEMVAARHDQAAQVPLLARHAMQRFDVGGDRHHRHQRGVGVHQQLAPGALDRHRLYRAPIGGESPGFDEAALREVFH